MYETLFDGEYNIVDIFSQLGGESVTVYQQACCSSALT